MKRHLGENDRVVLGTLGRSERPLSAYDILDRTDVLKAPVQVYRALQKLESRGLVHRIEALNAFVACADREHAHEHDHTQCAHRPGFVICRGCGAVREFEDRRIDEVAADAAGGDFAIELVALEVYGHCSGCRRAA